MKNSYCWQHTNPQSSRCPSHQGAKGNLALRARKKVYPLQICSLARRDVACLNAEGEGSRGIVLEEPHEPNESVGAEKKESHVRGKPEACGLVLHQAQARAMSRATAS